ncbi:MAG: sugar-binding domain-containing protein [Armatimonadota bacterium]
MIDTSVPRPEYPRPQFVRVDLAGNPLWRCLNGEWQFEIDSGDSGKERGLIQRELAGTITVPFCPESVLSGVENTDFLHAVWYRREIDVPLEWTGSDVVLHFGAVDYDATVWVNGTEVGRHRGGFTPFSVNLRGIASPGETAVVVVRARDENRIPQPRGKQAASYAPHGCHYTRTTGIWQTVWMEPLPSAAALKRPRITPDVANSAFHLDLPLTQNRPGFRLQVTLKSGSEVVATVTTRADRDLAPRVSLQIPDSHCRYWSPSDPFLYDVEIALLDASGDIIDQITSYTGLRSIAIDGKKVKINGETIFQRLVLDQGYYIEGVMTAPTDAALIKDIELSLEAGFNGARLHQKVFEERFLYHADRMGYLVWGEFADWGCSGYGPNSEHQLPGVTYVTQWLEALERDYSHPAIIGWCGLNETHQPLHDRITVLDDATRAFFLAAKAIDTTRPVLDTSGYAHRVMETDVYDSHDYITDSDFTVGLEKMRKRHADLIIDKPHRNLQGGKAEQSLPYQGQPYFVSEFGGFRWNPDVARQRKGNDWDTNTSWGYGSDPVSLDDFYYRFEAVCAVLMENPDMFGYCYTQLTDIYPEENGIYNFDRTSKFDNERLRAIQQRIAAIEELAVRESEGTHITGLK